MIRLKALREERNLNQRKIAMELQISQASISKYEVGKAEPDVQTIIKLSEYFNVSTDYMLGVTESRHSLQKSDLTDAEIEHITLYRSLGDRQKELAAAYIRGVLDGSKT